MEPLCDSATTSPQQRRWGGRRVLTRIVLVIASILLALFVSELLCRWLATPEPPVRFQQDVDKLGKFDMVAFARIIEADPELFWRMAPDRSLPDDAWPLRGVISNGQGLREDHDLVVPKPPGALRVLFVGDSCTFGYGLKHNEGFVDLVEKTLQSKMPSVSVECINAGVPGYTLFQGWRFLETAGYQYEPDVIVLCFGWNDADTWDGLSDAQHYAAMQAAKPPTWLSWSRLSQMLWAAMPTSKRSPEKSAERARLSTEEYGDLLEKIRQSATARGIEVVALAWPLRENVATHVSQDARTPMQAEVYRFGKRNQATSGAAMNSRCIDLIPVAQAMAEKHKPADLFLDVGHGTKLANESFSAAIADQLEPILQKRHPSR